MKIVILQKVIKQYKIIKSDVVIIHFYFQCARMTMNNISNSGGLIVKSSLQDKLKTMFKQKILVSERKNGMQGQRYSFIAFGKRF